MSKASVGVFCEEREIGGEGKAGEERAACGGESGKGREEGSGHPETLEQVEK